MSANKNSPHEPSSPRDDDKNITDHNYGCMICGQAYKTQEPQEGESWASKCLPTVLVCGHRFGYNCIEHWIYAGQHTCPICSRNQVYSGANGTSDCEHIIRPRLIATQKPPKPVGRSSRTPPCPICREQELLDNVDTLREMRVKANELREQWEKSQKDIDDFRQQYTTDLFNEKYQFAALLDRRSEIEKEWRAAEEEVGQALREETERRNELDQERLQRYQQPELWW